MGVPIIPISVYGRPLAVEVFLGPLDFGPWTLDSRRAVAALQRVGLGWTLDIDPMRYFSLNAVINGS